MSSIHNLAGHNLQPRQVCRYPVSQLYVPGIFIGRAAFANTDQPCFEPEAGPFKRSLVQAAWDRNTAGFHLGQSAGCVVAVLFCFGDSGSSSSSGSRGLVTAYTLPTTRKPHADKLHERDLNCIFLLFPVTGISSCMLLSAMIHRCTFVGFYFWLHSGSCPVYYGLGARSLVCIVFDTSLDLSASLAPSKAV